MGDSGVSRLCQRIFDAGESRFAAFASAVGYLARSGQSDQAFLMDRVRDSRLKDVTKAEILEGIARTPTPVSVQRIVELTFSPDKGSRVAAVWALSGVQDPYLGAALGAIGKAIRREAEVDVRNEFIHALGFNLRSVEVRAEMLSVMAGADPSPRCRKTALDGLVTIGAPGAMDVANQMSVLDPDPLLRAYAETIREKRRAGHPM